MDPGGEAGEGGKEEPGDPDVQVDTWAAPHTRGVLWGLHSH